MGRVALSRVLNGHASVSAALALALERIGWGTADHWMRMQASYDLAQERRDAYVALEWVYGAAPEADGWKSGGGTGPKPDRSIYEYWNKASEETRILFHELEELVKSLGSVRTVFHKTNISFKCTAVPGGKQPAVAWVRVFASVLDVHINGRLLGAISLEDDFARPIARGDRAIAIRDREHIRRAERLLRAAYDAVVGREHARSQATVPPKRVTREKFLESCDDNGRAVYARILDLADRQSMTVRWGPKGFTIGSGVDGTRVIVCYAYSPRSSYKQTLYTALFDKRGFRKIQAPEAGEQLHAKANRTGLFTPAGRDDHLAAWDCPFQAHRQPRAGRLGIAAQGGKGGRHPATLQACDGGLGRTEAAGELDLRQFRRRAGAHQRLDQCELVIGSRVLLPELGILHEAPLQILQSRHGITCFIRSLAVASARCGVFRDFFANTCSTTTRRSAAVT